jgi:hypothetical protein
MLEPCGHLDLAQDPLGAEIGRDLGPQDLYGDLAVVLRVLREVHRRHAARAELTLDAVSLGQGGS